MDIDSLQIRALEIARSYDRFNVAAGRQQWSTSDLALGFVGDVGDLAKLVLAADGRRVIPDARAKLGHELADCLWSVLVLAGRYDIDLVTEFTRMTTELEQHLQPPEGADAATDPAQSP